MFYSSNVYENDAEMKIRVLKTDICISIDTQIDFVRWMNLNFWPYNRHTSGFSLYKFFNNKKKMSICIQPKKESGVSIKCIQHKMKFILYIIRSNGQFRCFT